MPIEGLENVIRLPRLGKIRLGIKVEGQGSNSYPKAVDYFVCPPEIIEVYGEKPREIDVLFPFNDPDLFAPQYYKRYSYSQGLTCKGDGRHCRMKVDVNTGTFANHLTEEWVTTGRIPAPGEAPKEGEQLYDCAGEECTEYESKRCRKVMNLQVILPRVPGLGVWQIDTSSFNSMVNFNSMLRMLQGIFGRVAMIPLTMCVSWEERQPNGKTKKHVPIIGFRNEASWNQIATALKIGPPYALLEGVDEETPPDDLFPVQIIDERQQPQEPPEDTVRQDSARLTGWCYIRQLQQKYHFEDKHIRAAFRSAAADLDTDLTIPRTSLPDDTPEWATMELINIVAKRLMDYDSSTQDKDRQSQLTL